MLETLLARYLGKFLKGFTPEHISAHLLKGSVRLKEVDLDLAALTELLAEHLPCALQLRAVRCRAVALKVPWKRLRHKPVVVELSDVLVQAQVLPEELRAPQDLRRGQSNQPQEEVNIEEAEDEKKVEAQLKVGLKEVVGDGLQVLLNGLQVELFCEEGEISPLRLSVEAVHTFPCTVAGEKIDKPQDVYEFCDPCARLLRLVQVEGLRLETVDRGALVDLGAIRVQIEQRRWCGFIPQHRARRVCPFSSETTVSIRLDNVTLDLPLPAVKAVCSALLSLLKGGMPRKEELQAPASAPSASSASGADLCTWTAAQPGRGAATGLEWREQVVGRKTATLLSLGLTLAQCRVSLFLGTSSAALEATDFMFTLDMVSSLDAFRRRCLAELGLEPDEEFRGAAQALQRLFGIYLGSARLTWTEGTPTTLLALSGAPSVTFRWKDVFGVSESSQPIEGCIHNVQILVDVNAFPRLVEIVKDIALPFAELLEPPPFATSWCRVQLHQLQLELPAKEGAGGGSLPKIKVALPSLLVTSLGGLGELFTSLESLPRHAWQSTRDEDQSTGDLEVVEPEPCACGRQLGRHCFGAGLAPLRGLGSQRAWRARQVERGELVPIGYDEFAEMLRTHLSACALQAVLEAAEPADAEGGFFQAEQVSAQAGSPSGRSAGKRKSRGWLSGFKSSTKSGSSVSQRATEAATEWATLHEGLQRLRRQREEASLRLRALHEAQAEEARRIEARTASLEEEITLKIALERGKQAELSAKAEEQRQVLAQLLRARRAEQMKAAKP